MPEASIDEFVAFAHRLADAAAEQTLAHFRRRPDIDDKAESGKLDPVTEADRSAERVIRQLIVETYPDHGILGEEYGKSAGNSDYEWVIDPIDGTRGFVMGLPLWGTLICLQSDGEPIVGVLDQPYLGERFTGRGGAAEMRWNGGTEQLATSGCTRLADASLGTTTPEVFSHPDELAAFERAVHHARLLRYGGDCYLYGMLAAGHLDLVIEASLKPFDIAALIPIVHGAGGVVSTWSGGPAQAGGRIVAAATPALHAEVLEILNL